MSPRLLTDADIERSIKLRTDHYYAPGWTALALGLLLAAASLGSTAPAVGAVLSTASVALVLASAYLMGVGRERARSGR